MKRALVHGVWLTVSALVGVSGFALGRASVDDSVEPAAVHAEPPASDAGVGAVAAEAIGAALGAPAQEPAPTPESMFYEAAAMERDPMTIPQSEGAPVAVLSARVWERYDHKRLDFRVRNETAAAIDAMRFTSFCFDQFNDPVVNRNIFRVRTNTMAGTFQETLAPNATRNLSYWDLFGQETCTKAIVVVREVHFADGREWSGFAVQQEDPRAPAQ